MEINEKEMKLIMNFIKDDLVETIETESLQVKNKKIEKILEHIQQYLED